MEKRQKPYFRLTKAERASIERELAKRTPRCRELARQLGRSPATISDEARRNRTLARGASKGARAGLDAPEGACERLLKWPWTCNGCPLKAHCGRKWGASYSAARAQALADEELSASRRGVDCSEERFDWMMDRIRSDVARGLSPAQIAQGRAGEFKVSASTIYRWISRGYGGMCNADLRRKVGYRERRKAPDPRPAAHGEARSHAAFSALPEEERARACEMDTVVGRARDRKRILTLYLRPFKAQLCVLLPDGSSSAVAAALDMLERACGADLFGRLFGLLLTDNGAEFSDPEAIERSALGGGPRCRVYYCDPRQSQQKGACERNHVELRKLLPKGRGITFDELDARDMAELMSQMNSEPRKSLLGASPTALLKAAVPGSDELLDALGVREIPYEKLDLTLRALNAARAERGLPPLA